MGIPIVCSRSFLIAAYVLLLLAGHFTENARSQDESSAAMACAEFTTDVTSASSWEQADCMDVWTEWTETVPRELHERYRDRRSLREIGERLRERGSSCLVHSQSAADGAGSKTVRSIASWLFAEEMGCDWVSPEWGNTALDGNGTTKYCHRTSTFNEVALMSQEQIKAMQATSCSLVNWHIYFRFDKPSVPMPATGVIKTVTVDPLLSWDEIEIAYREMQTFGVDGLTWDHLLIRFSPSIASRYFLSLMSWDAFKREAVRNGLNQLRQNFHEVPRPGYNHNTKCSYDPERLNFAMHVRMGDRRQFQGANLEYFQLLELFIDTVTAGVVEEGQPPPLFHIFSETLNPCPDTETDLFEEFPSWPVEVDQIQPCVSAEAPSDCAEKRAHVDCSAERLGVFKVRGKPLLLHVSPDVVGTLSCMIQADGVLMGCSTFGQVAGLLTKGISFFSVQCGGDMTPAQYKMMPPMAVAERGDMWVPIAGSWRDPLLQKQHIFRGALRKLLETKAMSL